MIWYEASSGSLTRGCPFESTIFFVLSRDRRYFDQSRLYVRELRTFEEGRRLTFSEYSKERQPVQIWHLSEQPRYSFDDSEYSLVVIEQFEDLEEPEVSLSLV